MNAGISNKFKQISLAIFVGLMILQTGCKEEEKTLDTLSGTVWKCVTDDMGYDWVLTFIFQKNTFTYTSLYGNEDPYIEQGTYIYESPIVTFYSSDGTSSGQAIIQGNQMTVIGGDNFVYIKQ